MLNNFEIVKLQLAEIAYKCLNKQLPFSSSSYFKDVLKNFSHDIIYKIKENQKYFRSSKRLELLWCELQCSQKMERNTMHSKQKTLRLSLPLKN